MLSRHPVTSSDPGRRGGREREVSVLSISVLGSAIKYPERRSLPNVTGGEE